MVSERSRYPGALAESGSAEPESCSVQDTCSEKPATVMTWEAPSTLEHQIGTAGMQERGTGQRFGRRGVQREPQSGAR